MGIIPPPWNYLAIVLVALALAVGGAVVGAEWEQGREAKRAIDGVQKTLVRTRTVIQKDNKALEASQAENRTLRSDNERLQKEVAVHAQTIPDRPECRFAPERVRTVRRAWGVELGADPGAGEDGLRGAEGRPVSGVGQPQRDRGVAGALGPQVPGMPQR